MFITEVDEWAEELFGPCQLGDRRRTRRLIRYAADQARHAAASTAAATEGDAARRLGAYRLLHNQQVDAEEVAEGAYAHAFTLAEEAEQLLAIEDTTSVAYSHAVREQLGDVGGHFGARTARGFQAHSVLLVNATEGTLYGLVEQYRWQRPPEQRGGKHQRRQRPYLEKESYKWERASARLRPRLQAYDLLARTLWVSDREADIYEYLQEKHQRQERFLVRAAQDRLLRLPEGFKLRTHLAGQPLLGHFTVAVGQRQSRPAREATLALRSASVVLQPTSRRGNPQERLLKPLPVQVVWAREEKPPPSQQALEWMLLTSEPVATFEQARRVVSFYSQRWQIEEFHKAWKSGCRVEERRLQSPEALERLAVILAFVAVRLLQLRQWRRSQTPCTEVLSEEAWPCLWQAVETSPLPAEVPSMEWAYVALARLGGFYDSKRTGRAGWETLWRGWQRLSERLEGWRAARTLYPHQL